MRPRPYISHRQLTLWEQSPEEYMATYFENKRQFTNRGMALGKVIADALETGEETGEFDKDMVIAQFTKYGIRDEKILCEWRQGKEVVPILIRPDTIETDFSALVEYKTGTEKYPWTQKKVDENSQLTFYAAGVYARTGKVPKLKLQWAPTRMVEGPDGIDRPELTGEVRTFETVRSISQVLGMIVRMRKAWKEIGEACEAQLA